MKKDNLKTLEDLEYLNDHPNWEGDLIDKSELKAEAVKWVKVLNIKAKELEGKLRTRYNMENLAGFCAMHEWIKQFFNLTEEDLK